MQAKTYTIQGQSFTMIPNDLNLLNKAAPLIAKLRRLIHSYTGDLDMSVRDAYMERINELEEAQSQLKIILDSGLMDEVPITDEIRTAKQAQYDDLTPKIKAAQDEFLANTQVQSLLKLKQELESYALIELLTDVDFLKPILKKILTGGNVDAVKFDDADSVGFIRDVVTDFFTVMNSSNLR